MPRKLPTYRLLAIFSGKTELFRAPWKRSGNLSERKIEKKSQWRNKSDAHNKQWHCSLQAGRKKPEKKYRSHNRLYEMQPKLESSFIERDPINPDAPLSAVKFAFIYFLIVLYGFYLNRLNLTRLISYVRVVTVI